LVQSGFHKTGNYRSYRNKLETLRLDEGTKASTYVNDFIICCQKLEEKNKGYTLSTKRQTFFDQITDEEYDVAKQWLTGDENKTFDNCVVKIRAREHHLLKEGNDSLLKARRFKKNEESKPKRSGGIPGQTIPSIPGYILYKVMPETKRQDLIKRRGMYNSEGRII
jgi:cysteinyl-tRNA synthetase